MNGWNWRSDERVVQAERAREQAAAEVARLEREQAAAQAGVAEAQAKVEQLSGASSNNGSVAPSLADINRAKTGLAGARGRLAECEQAAEAAYAVYGAAESQVAAAAAAAQAEAWPLFVDEYREAVKALDVAVVAALESEEQVERLHRLGLTQFGANGDGWLRSPLPDGERVGDGSFARRPLQRVAVTSWRAWVAEHVLNEPARANVVKLGARLRALAGA